MLAWTLLSGRLPAVRRTRPVATGSTCRALQPQDYHTSATATTRIRKNAQQ
jgi:hypothetical protein